MADELIDLGVLEANVTGGEPLLRRDLVLEVLEKLTAAGLGVVLSTNGWFVDAALADRLAALPGLRVYLSIDGAAPSVHDGARGVPGSWRRAVTAANLLLERDVTVEVVSVVTPDNVAQVPDFLEAMAALGVAGISLAPVQPIGAASRSRRWVADRRRIDAAVSAFQGLHGERPNVRVRRQVEAALRAYRHRVPRAMLLRPNGKVRIDSLNPFVFGDATRDGLAECWRQIATRWDDPDVTRWARDASHGDGVVAYRDGDVEVEGGARTSEPPPSAPAPASATQQAVTAAELAEARTEVDLLAASRRYRLGEVRWVDDVNGTRLVRVRDSNALVRLNRTAGAVMDACDGGTVADAAARLAAGYPGEDPERLRNDATASLERLLADRIIRPALAPAR